MLYRTSTFYRLLPNRKKQHGVAIIARNGQKIADCKTQKMAEKITAGLILYDEQQKKKAEFTL